ncbi:LOW QUALITY PROTEIN: anoctamin-8-like [Galleria mellonella]|uniref:Anoctamin n=1 Tax=Galleria mellonella TaxID=7137 RepID=A0ABM3N377_GALME|nr:LOW QUALITY PROTEIN: anoctamin-8-like [Galleria mellonella]
MEGDDGTLGNNEKDEYESSSHSTPQEHKSFAEFAKDKLDSAGRELRRRLPMAGQLGAHLMHPRRLLLHSTPTQHTDVVLIFPKGLPDSMLLWLLQKLRGSRPRLRVCVRQHASSQCSAFYITADDDVLLQTAEEVHLPKLLKPEFGGGYKEFTVRDMHCFQKGTSASELLNSQERGALVKHVLESARAEPGDEHALEPALTLRPGQSIVPACVSRGVVASMFPLHDRNALESLRKKWVKTFFSPQPLDEISEYFGVKIAMYFAWLGHYTQSLTVPAVVGFLFWIWLGTANENWKDIAYVLFSLFNVLWACVYLETWKRYSNVLAYKWGTLDQRDELLVEPRPLFQGEMGTSPVTGRPEPQYAAWRRRAWRHLVSLPVMLLCLSVAAAATFGFLRAQDWWESNIIYFTWFPRAILAIIIWVEEEVYARIARWLNDKENYRLETKYENHLIVKIALFQFVNSFMSLFYIAFYLQDMDKLKEQLAVLLITRQVIGNLKESALPYLIENLRLAKICVDVFGAISPSKIPTSAQLAELFEKKTDSGELPENSLTNGAAEKDERRDSEPIVGQKIIHQAELESQLFKYEGTFAEYLEMLTQLGHVVLFSSAFPLAAVCALLNNAAEVRADAFKLCHVAQRPFGERVSSVGSWQHAMEAMVGVAVLVNCALIGLSGPVHRLWPDAAPAHTVLLIVALEHVILIVVLALRIAIPEIPGWLATEMAKVEFQRREAIKNAHAPLMSECPSQDDVRTSARSTPRATPASPAPPAAPAAATPTRTPTTPKGTDKSDRRRINIGKIPEIPPFRPKAASITEPVVNTGSLQLLQDVSPTKPIRRKEAVGGAPLSLLGVRGLRDEPLHRSAHCIPQPAHHRPLVNPTLQELSGSVSAGGSEPDLNAVPSASPSIDASATSSEDDKPKDKGGRSRAKAALVKRVRSVAVFSLGLKRAREAAAAARAPAHTPHTPDKGTMGLPAPMLGGELSLIPIEQLIQVEDVKRN